MPPPAPADDLQSSEWDVIVVGAGPAGLSVAAECSYHGVPGVLVLEKGETHNQTVLRYYPDDKRVDAAYRGQEAVCAGVLCFRDTTKAGFLDIVDRMLALYRFELRTNEGVDSIRRRPQGGFAVSTTGGAVHHSRHVVVAIGRMS
ncbi:MAG: NAD(P)-binding domain-containing protein, partial [Elusimicrobia bacterium]|nr:NAD(P)-binding domain-containing protein [Elusimicrobiota bacterium]